MKLAVDPLAYRPSCSSPCTRKLLWGLSLANQPTEECSEYPGGWHCKDPSDHNVARNVPAYCGHLARRPDPNDWSR